MGENNMLNYSRIYVRDYSLNEIGVVSAIIKKNHKILDKMFFEKGVLFSANIKYKASQGIEILFLKSYEDIKNTKNIYVELKDKINIPSYQDYCSEISRLSGQSDPVRKIIGKIKRTNNMIQMSEQVYCVQIKIILEKFINKSFINISEKNDFDLYSGPPIVLKSTKIKKDTLCFTGEFIDLDSQKIDIKMCVTYKLIEKLYGDNSFNSIYRDLRSEGHIYTGLSGYLMEFGVFYTGVIMLYNENKEALVYKKLSNIIFDNYNLELARKQFMQDVALGKLQYGSEYVCFPYILALNRDVHLEELYDEVNNITIADINNHLENYDKIRLEIE